MAKLLKLRRGTTSQHSSFTGAEGEVTVDTDKEALVVHNGSTAGGFPVARADGTGVANFTITGELDAATLDISGNADIDGTLEADAYTVNGTALDTHIAGVTVTNATNAAGLTGTPNVTVGVVTAGSLDISGDADIDGTLEADAYTVNGTALDTHIAGVTVSNATNSATFTTTANNSTNETVYPVFVDGATGAQGAETDTGLTYNPNTGLLSTAAVTTTGNVVVGGNLQVDGTTTTVNSSTMTVTDKNIEIAKGAANDAAADGAGITVDSGDGDKTWNWVDATDAWTSSEHIHLLDSKKVLLGTGSDFDIHHDGSNSYITNTTGNIVIQAKQTESSITAIPDGAVELYHNNVKKIETTAAGVTVTGSVTDDKGDVRKIIQNTQGSTYTLVAADAGKHILASGAITLPPSVFAAGDAVTIVNNTSGDIAINVSGGSVYNAADAGTGNWTLSQRGVVTVIWISATVAHISGAGLS